MPERLLPVILQILIGVGLLNVWLIRARSATRFRGGTAQSLREEFAAYGLPSFMFYLVGALKVLAGVTVLLGIWVPLPVSTAIIVVGLLMLGALAMHLKVKDPGRKSVPAALVLALCVAWLLVR